MYALYHIVIACCLNKETLALVQSACLAREHVLLHHALRYDGIESCNVILAMLDS